MITLTARFTMKEGMVPGALALVDAVRAESDEDQPGTLIYLVHRALDKQYQPTLDLVFYECYRDDAALEAHLASPSWKAVVAGWSQYFEGTSSTIEVTSLGRIGGFVHLSVLSQPASA